ncbi:MAG: cyclase family protein [Gammaproteobacteria bacterium]
MLSVLRFVLFCSLFTAVSAHARPIASQQTLSIKNIVDLTHTLTEDFPYNPISGVYYPFDIDTQTTVKKDGVASNEWKIHEHIGTQIDAPSHFIADGKSLDQMPVEDFIVPLAVIDISERAEGDPDATVTVDDIKAWEKRYGRLPQGAAVFMYSGWGAKVDDPKAFVNLDASNTMHARVLRRTPPNFLSMNVTSSV